MSKKSIWNIEVGSKWRYLDVCACCGKDPRGHIEINSELGDHYEIECANSKCANFVLGLAAIETKINWNIEQRIRSGRITID